MQMPSYFSAVVFVFDISLSYQILFHYRKQSVWTKGKLQFDVQKILAKRLDTIRGFECHKFSDRRRKVLLFPNCQNNSINKYNFKNWNGYKFPPAHLWARKYMSHNRSEYVLCNISRRESLHFVVLNKLRCHLCPKV